MSLPVNALTPRARRTIITAGALAEQADQLFIGTEHLLLALAEDADGLAGQLLDRLGVREAVVEQAALAVVGHREPSAIAPNLSDDVIVRFDPSPQSNHPLRRVK
jgi:ATP-dependent Clp protease ATP-binding subunit ClpA